MQRKKYLEIIGGPIWCLSPAQGCVWRRIGASGRDWSVAFNIDVISSSGDWPLDATLFLSTSSVWVPGSMA